MSEERYLELAVVIADVPRNTGFSAAGTADGSFSVKVSAANRPSVSVTESCITIPL
jgi:hypothetical protein